MGDFLSLATLNARHLIDAVLSLLRFKPIPTLIFMGDNGDEEEDAPDRGLMISETGSC